MKDLEPRVYRQRLIIEARYAKPITEDLVKRYLLELTRVAGMTVINGPFISSATGKAKPIHAGYEGAVIWAESGAQIYTWEQFNFLTVDVYTCKRFDDQKLIDFTREFFQLTELETLSLPLKRD